jgi:hypothetical protein
VSSQHPLSDGYAYGTVYDIHTTSHHYSASSGKPSINNSTMFSTSSMSSLSTWPALPRFAAPAKPAPTWFGGGGFLYFSDLSWGTRAACRALGLPVRLGYDGCDCGWGGAVYRVIVPEVL